MERPGSEGKNPQRVVVPNDDDDDDDDDDEESVMDYSQYFPGLRMNYAWKISQCC